MIRMHSAEHRLEGKAELTLRLEKPADRVYFTLRNYLVVESVALADENERLQWRRDGSVLAVRLPERYRQGARLRLTIAYSGTVWEWGTRARERPNGPLNFVASSFSLLRSGQAWYPIPGVQPLYICQAYTILGRPAVGTAVWASRAIHPVVAFRLTVDSDTDNMALSNLERTGVETLSGAYKKRYRFGSLRGRDVFLMVGPYRYQKKTIPGGSGFMEIYAFPQHQARVAAVLNSLAKPYRFYQDLLQPRLPGPARNVPYWKCRLWLSWPAVRSSAET